MNERYATVLFVGGFICMLVAGWYGGQLTKHFRADVPARYRDEDPSFREWPFQTWFADRYTTEGRRVRRRMVIWAVAAIIGIVTGVTIL